MTEETPEIPTAGTWRESVDEFVRDAPWLTGRDKPQLKALYSIADKLDGDTFQAALISQFTLVHRGLMARNPAAKASGKGGAGEPDADGFLEMFGVGPDPAEIWRADQ
jgi:hypothetical protein